MTPPTKRDEELDEQELTDRPPPELEDEPDLVERTRLDDEDDEPDEMPDDLENDDELGDEM